MKMRAIVAISENSEDSSISQRFGRAPFFAIIDLTNNEIQIHENLFSGESGGVGTRVATWIIKQDIDILITKQLGPNAKEILEHTDIEIFYPGSLKLNEISSAYEQNRLWKYTLDLSNRGSNNDSTNEKIISEDRKVRGQGRGRIRNKEIIK